MKKLMMGLLVLSGLGGTGFAGWWFLIDAEPRSLGRLMSFDEDENEDAWVWAASHGDRPAVREALGEQFRSLLNNASVGGRPDDWQARRIRQLGAVFERNPITEPELASQAMTTWARFDHPPALGWVKDPTLVSRALVGALENLTRAFRSKELVNLPLAHAETTRLLGELASRNQPADSQPLVHVVVQCWTRFRAPAAGPAFEHARSAFPTEFQAALIDRLIYGTTYSLMVPDEEEVVILVRELGALKPELTVELLQAIARLSEFKATPRLLQTWGPAAIEAMRAARPRFESYAQTEADTLLAKLGSVEPGAVRRKIDSISAYVPGEPVLRERPTEDTLGLIMSCDHDIDARVARVVSRVTDELAQFPPAALLEAWQNGDDTLTLHVVSRALARADPEALTTALAPSWDEFSPVARAAEAARLRTSGLDPITVSQYQRLARRLWEGLVALHEVEKPGVAALRHLWPAVSSPSPHLSRLAVALLDRHLTDDEFVLGLFSYFDLRSSYSSGEVEGWIALMSRRQQSQKLLGQTLDRLLDAVGKPEGIPLVHKVVGLSALSRSACDCGAVLQRYAADTSTYQDVHFRENAQGVQSDRRATTRRFADLAKAALAR